jgi:hypothetical protein
MPRRQARAIVIHSLAHARAALAAAAQGGESLILLSAPHAATYAGAGWFDAVTRAAAAAQPEAKFTAVLDCGDRADLAQAALRQGLRHICYRGHRDVAARLADIAAQLGATLHTRRPAALDLLDAADPLAACRAYLAGD